MVNINLIHIFKYNINITLLEETLEKFNHSIAVTQLKRVWD